MVNLISSRLHFMVMPINTGAVRVNLMAANEIESFINCKTHLNTGLLLPSGFGKVPLLLDATSCTVPLCIKRVTSLPSSTDVAHPSVPGITSICSVESVVSLILF